MKTAPQNMEREAKKWFEIMTGQGRNVSLQKVVNRWDLRNITLFAAMCGACLAELDMFSMFEDYFEVFGGGTRLAMSKTICAPDTSSLKPGSGATEGVLD